jgi:hypothetical protein
LHQATQVSGIESESRSEVAEVGTLLPDLEEYSRLTKWPIAAEEVVVEGSGSLCDESIEAANLCDVSGEHCLTLVR